METQCPELIAFFFNTFHIHDRNVQLAKMIMATDIFCVPKCNKQRPTFRQVFLPKRTMEMLQ